MSRPRGPAAQTEGAELPGELGREGSQPLPKTAKRGGRSPTQSACAHRQPQPRAAPRAHVAAPAASQGCPRGSFRLCEKVSCVCFWSRARDKSHGKGRATAQEAQTAPCRVRPACHRRKVLVGQAGPQAGGQAPFSPEPRETGSEGPSSLHGVGAGWVLPGLRGWASAGEHLPAPASQLTPAELLHGAGPGPPRPASGHESVFPVGSLSPAPALAPSAARVGKGPPQGRVALALCGACESFCLSSCSSPQETPDLAPSREAASRLGSAQDVSHLLMDVTSEPDSSQRVAPLAKIFKWRLHLPEVTGASAPHPAPESDLAAPRLLPAPAPAGRTCGLGAVPQDAGGTGRATGGPRLLASGRGRLVSVADPGLLHGRTAAG